MADGSIVIDTKIDGSGLKTQLANLKRSMMGTAAELRDIMQGPVAAIRGLEDAFGGLYRATVGQSAIIEDMTAAFTPLVGSAADAKAMIAALRKEAAATPYTLKDIGDATKQLLPFLGNDVKKVTETFRMLGDTAGGNAQKLESITRGYSKAMLKGKVDMEALNMIADAGVPIYDELATSMGVSVAEMMDMSSQGKVTSADLTKAFKKMTSEGGTFYHGMIIASKTLNGVMSTMDDAFAEAGATIGDLLLPIIKAVVLAVTDALSAFINWAKTGDNLIDALSAIGYTIAAVAGGFLGYTIASAAAAISSGALSVAFGGVTTALNVMKVALMENPLTALAVVITAVLIPAIVYLIRHWDLCVANFSLGFAKLKQGFADLFLGDAAQKAAADEVSAARKTRDEIEKTKSDAAKADDARATKHKQTLAQMSQAEEDYQKSIKGAIGGQALGITSKVEADAAILEASIKKLKDSFSKINPDDQDAVDKFLGEDANAKIVDRIKLLNKVVPLEQKIYDIGLSDSKLKSGFITEAEYHTEVAAAIQKQVDALLKYNEIAKDPKVREQISKLKEDLEDEKALAGVPLFYKALGSVLPEEIAKGVSSATYKATSAIKRLIENAAEAAEAMWDIFKGALDITVWISDFDPAALYNDFKGFMDGLTKFFTTNLGSIPIFFDMAVKLVTTFLDTVEGQLPNIIKTVKNVIDHIVGYVSKNGGAIIKRIVAFVGAIAIAIVQKIPVMFAAVVDSMIALFTSISKIARPLIRGVMQAVSQMLIYLSSHAGEIIAALVDIAMMITLGVIDSFPDIAAALIASTPYIVEAFAVNLPAEIIKNLPEIIKSIIVAFAETLIQVPTELAKACYDVGKNIILGIVKGVTEYGPKIWEGMKKIFDSFIHAVKAFFGIHSPSTLFFNFGVNIIQGLINGILSIGSSLINVFLSLLSGLGDVFSQALKKALELGVSIISSIVSGITTTESSITDALIRGVSKALSETLDLANQFLDVGSQIGKRLMDGIVSALKAIDISSIIGGGGGSGGGGIIGGITGAAGGVIGGIGHHLGFARGTNDAPGGLALVGEEGPELVDLPAHSRVYTAAETKRMLSSRGYQSILSGLTSGISMARLAPPATPGGVQSITLNNQMTGSLVCDGREIGRIAFENIDRSYRSAYGY